MSREVHVLVLRETSGEIPLAYSPSTRVRPDGRTESRGVHRAPFRIADGRRPSTASAKRSPRSRRPKFALSSLTSPRSNQAPLRRYNGRTLRATSREAASAFSRRRIPSRTSCECPLRHWWCNGTPARSGCYARARSSKAVCSPSRCCLASLMGRLSAQTRLGGDDRLGSSVAVRTRLVVSEGSAFRRHPIVTSANRFPGTVIGLRPLGFRGRRGSCRRRHPRMDATGPRRNCNRRKVHHQGRVRKNHGGGTDRSCASSLGAWSRQ